MFGFNLFGNKKEVTAMARRHTYPGRRYQTGRTTKAVDRMRHARKPGRRTSASGNTYYERRKNRSDKRKWL